MNRTHPSTGVAKIEVGVYKLWNPLKLDAPAIPFERPNILILYLCISQERYSVFPIFTLRVQLGNYSKPSL